MKKVLLAIAAVAMLFATSCKKDNNAPENMNLGENEFLATIDNGANPQNAPIIHEGNSPQTTIDGNRYVIWENGDEISINGATYTTSTSGNSVVFSTSGTQASGNEFHAFYAVNNSNGNQAELPTTQTYVSGKVSNLPMYAYSTSHKLTFNNICAVLKITIPSYVAGASSIEVSSDQAMNGAFTIQGDSAKMTNASPSAAEKKITVTKQGGNFAENDVVYIAVPAGQYTNLKIKFNGGASAWEKTLASCTLNVNKIYPINATPACLCFTALEGNSTVSFAAADLLEYSTDNGETWHKYGTADSVITLSSAGDKVYFKAHQNQNLIYDNVKYTIRNFSGTGSLKVSGNIMYLLKADGSLTNLTVGTNNFAFALLFYNMTVLKDASELSLPATTLADRCYLSMFCGCSNLTAAPALPATTLANYCYRCMFTGCSSLTTAPALSATTLAEQCYYDMFDGCSSLTTAPALPAETLATYCYADMFKDCSSLTTAPNLPAETLASNCYTEMFKNCSSLTTAPALPAETLATNCYNHMFSGCTKLTTAPTLPATTLANSCYYYMFEGCSSLTTAPALPAETLAAHCYANMFTGCSSLTTAPALPATTFVTKCYEAMFKDCSKLNYIEVSFNSWGSNGETQYWVSGVAASGTFKCPNGLPDLRGADCIPSGWTKVDK